MHSNQPEIQLPNGWEYVDLLGKGSFGRVYRAKRTIGQYTEWAAVKHISIPSDQEELDAIYADLGTRDKDKVNLYLSSILQIMLDEYLKMKSLEGNTNIVTCHDIQQIPKVDGIGYDVYIWMELLESLSKYSIDHKIDRSEVIRIGMDICQALSLLRKKGIVHRDIKPQNIFINKQGNFKLGDFGTVREVKGTSTMMSVKGTVSYMSPEIMLGRSAGFTSDIYSLGLVMYKLMNRNRHPFIQETDLNSTRSIEESNSKRFNGEKLPLPVDADEKLGQIILKACAYAPKDRWQTPEEMYQALMDLTDGDNKKRDRSKHHNIKLALAAVAVLIVAAAGYTAGYVINNLSNEKQIIEVTAISEPNATAIAESPVAMETNAMQITEAAGTDSNEIQTAEETSIPESNKLVIAESTTATESNEKAITDATPTMESNSQSNIPDELHSDTPSTPDTPAYTEKELSQANQMAAEVLMDSAAETDNSESTKELEIAMESETDEEPVEDLSDEPEDIRENYAFVQTDKNDYEYELVSDGVKITKYTGNDESIIIPDSIDSKPVTMIGARAFAWNEKLKAIVLSNNMREIEHFAFLQCPALSNVNIPDSVVKIEHNPFAGCLNLRNVDISDNHPVYQLVDSSIIQKEEHTLVACLSAKTNGIYSVPSGVKTIGVFALGYCSNLISVVIPDTVRTIDEFAFSDCTGISSISLPDSVKEIEQLAFNNCSNLETINFPDGVRLTQSPFWGCTKLASIHVSPNHPILSVIDNVLYSKHLDTRLEPARNLLVYPPTLTNSYFSIPSDVKAIRNYAFYDCINLESVTIPKGVSEIGWHAFANCSNLKSINIPDTFIKIYPAAFRGCTSLTSDNVIISSTNPYYYIKDNSLIDKAEKKLINYFSSSPIETYTVPSEIQTIELYAFSDCSNLMHVSIPEGVKTIETHAFYNCQNLSTIIIPKSVEEISGELCKNAPYPFILLYRDSYAEKYCQEHNLKYGYVN